MASAERGEWFEKQTLGSLPERAARRWGSREALCFKGRRLDVRRPRRRASTARPRG